MYPGKGNAADLSLAQTSWEESIRAYSLSATTSAFGVWAKAIAEECARNGGWATLHSEKIRLNRYNRRRVRQALRCNPFAEVPQNIRINKRDIM